MGPLARRLAAHRQPPTAPRHDGQPAFTFDEVRPDDTYLVSFPRSGNTYLRNLLTALVLDRRPTPADVQDVVPDIHWCDGTQRPSSEAPLLVKSHAPPSIPVPAKVVYLVRDGRAALLSYFRYLQRRGRPTPAHADDMLTWPGTWPSSWSDHVAGWLDRLGHQPGSMVVRYEDLVADPTAILGQVAGLAGLDYTEPQRRRAVGHSSRRSMRQAEQAGGPGSLNHVGLGQADLWPTVFSTEARRRFEAAHGDLLSRLGYPLEQGNDG